MEQASKINYSLNFLWVNLNPQDRVQDVAQHIFGEGTDPLLYSNIVTSLERWAHTNPGIEINLWCEGQYLC